MFYGEHTNKLDDKNRMRIPAKFREELGSGYKIVQGFDGCLFAMTKEEFDKFVQPFSDIPLGDIVGQRKRTKLMSTVFVPEEDGQGRFVLPANNKKIAKINKELKYVGVGEMIQIWSAEEYDRIYAVEDDSLTMDEIYSSVCVVKGVGDGI
ncbi:MAG: hypothetical protein R3Y23_04880 [Bacillota bacterium]